ncbi:MAG: hypothetical protein HOE90_05345 [Bacteriovoracaceae bacterium]|jgi:hypothetical protein|nr:hypothetical protein [Bacteriovoracaceae bacterium]
MSRNKKSPLTEKQKKVVCIETYKMQIAELKAKAETAYAPKLGRQIKSIERKIKRIA